MVRYVALGSSMAAGPGISPRASGSPRPAMRSARNYPHLLAAGLGLDLTDVTYSGATTAHVLRDPQNGTTPQILALDGSEELVTITIGGNDIAYVPGMYVATAPAVLRLVPSLIPGVGQVLHSALDRGERDAAIAILADSMVDVGRAVRERSPRARVLFVEYLTLLPPPGQRSWPLSEEHAELARHLARRLVEVTGAAAQESGAEVVGVAGASRDHHAWSADPWTVGATLPLPGRPLPYHPNLAGMRAVATMIGDHLAD